MNEIDDTEDQSDFVRLVSDLQQCPENKIMTVEAETSVTMDGICRNLRITSCGPDGRCCLRCDRNDCPVGAEVYISFVGDGTDEEGKTETTEEMTEEDEFLATVGTDTSPSYDED